MCVGSEMGVGVSSHGAGAALMRATRAARTNARGRLSCMVTSDLLRLAVLLDGLVVERKKEKIGRESRTTRAGGI